jgi:hypothetical protein
MSRKPKVGDVIYFDLQTDKAGKLSADNASIEVVSVNKITNTSHRKIKTVIIHKENRCMRYLLINIYCRVDCYSLINLVYCSLALKSSWDPSKFKFISILTK